MVSPVKHWLEPVLGTGEHEPVLPKLLITLLTLGVSLLGAGLAWALFRNGTAEQEQPAGVLVTAARRNLYTDAFNEAVFERPGIYLTRALVFLDNKGVDGLVNGIAASVGGGSGRLRRLQTGFVRSYALSMLTGALLVVGAFLAIQLGWLA
jgi:NADH-quinone oxidoreductase subunit L